MSAELARSSSVLRRPWFWIPAAVVAVVLVVYIAAFVYVGASVPRGAEVRGVDIGAMPVAAAEEKLDAELGAAATKPMQVEVGGKKLALDPKEAGLSFDAKATAEAAGTRSLNPLKLATQVFGTNEVDPVVHADEQKLTAAVKSLAASVDRPVREGQVVYGEDMKPRAIMPKSGSKLEKKATAKVKAAFPATKPVSLAMAEAKPKSAPEDVKKVAATDAVTAVSADVTLGTGAKHLPVEPEAIAANTEFVADSTGTLKPSVDAAGLAKDVGDLDRLEIEPKDADFALSGGQPKVVPSKDGRMVDRKKLGTAVASVLGEKSSEKRTVDAPLTKAEPKLTTAEAKKLGIKEKVSTFTTHHPCCEGRVTNIHQAADILDDTLVKPGKTFSLNGTLGERTRAKGFVPAPMILEGLHKDSVGGGVSQIATTTFNAMFFAGLKDVQHQPHSYWISRYPLGREATISWTQPDLRFKNDQDTGILITTSYTDTSITVNMWGTKHYDIEATEPQKSNYRDPGTIRDDSKDCTPGEPAKGYDVTYSRIFKQGGNTVRTEPFKTVYKAEPKVICTKDDKKKKD